MNQDETTKSIGILYAMLILIIISNLILLAL
jgi:hypothetical protein